MMDILRKTTNSFIFKIIFWMFIVSFIFSNMSNYLINISNNYAAKINNKKISFNQFENSFSIECNRIQKKLGNYKYSEIFLNKRYMKDLRQQVLNNLINNVLLNQYAEKLGLSISNEQVKKVILSTKEFQSNGQFNHDRYNSIIRNMGISFNQYAQSLRDQIMIQQLISAIIDTDFMFKSEIDKLISIFSQKRVVREITIDINAFINQQDVNNTEITNYYERNKNAFFIPEQFRVKYIKLDVKEIKENVSNNEIQSYYNQYKEQFSQSQLNRYAVIQIKNKIDAETILNDLKKGADFATIAKEKSTDAISAKNGGDIGWLADEVTPYELKNAGLKKKGQISNLIKFSNGYLIIRVNDIKPATIKPLEKVRNEIVEKIKKKKAIHDYYILRKKISNAINDNKNSFSIIEQILDKKSIKTDWFSQDNLPKELNSKLISDAIFNKSLINKKNIFGNNNNIIIDNGNCSYVLNIFSYHPKIIKPLEIVKDEIVIYIKRNKAIQKAKEKANKLLFDLKSGRLHKVINRNGISFGSLKILSYTGMDPINQKVFSLENPEKGKPSYGIISDIQRKIVILALYEVRKGNISEKQKRVITQNIVQNHRNLVFEALTRNLRKKAKIKINKILE